MTTPADPEPRHIGAYRALTVLYPQAFRREYRDDLVALFAAQLVAETPTRVWGRAIRDLGVTVPAQHLEAHMSRATDRSGTIAAVALAVAIASLLAALGAGSGGSVAFSIAFLVLALAASLTALWSWRAGRGVLDRVTGPVWWHFLVGGTAGMLALIVAPELIGGGDADLPDGIWYVWFVGALLSIALFAVGALLGLGRLVALRHAHH